MRIVKLDYIIDKKEYHIAHFMSKTGLSKNNKVITFLIYNIPNDIDNDNLLNAMTGFIPLRSKYAYNCESIELFINSKQKNPK